MGKLATSRDNNPPTQKPIILPDLKQFCDTMKAEIDHLDFKERQYVVRQLVDTVVTDGATASVEGSISLVIPEENTQNNYGQNSINRYSWTSKRRQKYSFQCPTQKTGGKRRQLPFLHHRTKRRNHRGT